MGNRFTIVSSKYIRRFILRKDKFLKNVIKSIPIRSKSIFKP